MGEISVVVFITQVLERMSQRFFAHKRVTGLQGTLLGYIQMRRAQCRISLLRCVYSPPSKGPFLPLGVSSALKSGQQPAFERQE